MDVMFNLRGDIDIHRDIILLEIDDKTIDAYASGPLKKDVYARIVEVLSKARVRAIGFDMSFSSVNDYLASAITNARTVSLGFEFKTDRVSKDKNIPVASHALLPSPRLLTGARSIGHISILPDNDGIVRHIPLLIKYGDKTYPCLPLQMVALISHQ